MEGERDVGFLAWLPGDEAGVLVIEKSSLWGGPHDLGAMAGLVGKADQGPGWFPAIEGRGEEGAPDRDETDQMPRREISRRRAPEDLGEVAHAGREVGDHAAGGEQAEDEVNAGGREGKGEEPRQYPRGGQSQEGEQEAEINEMAHD